MISDKRNTQNFLFVYIKNVWIQMFPIHILLRDIREFMTRKDKGLLNMPKQYQLFGNKFHEFIKQGLKLSG